MSARRNGNRARCQHDGCEKFAQTRGLCKAHGGGSRCRDPSCNKLAQSRGLCIAHGGGRRCQHEGCSKLAQSKGFCISHGGGRRCTVPNCEKFSQVKGRCKSHSKLAENSDQDADENDGDDTESERGSVGAMASPPPLPRVRTRQESDHHHRMASPPSPLSQPHQTHGGAAALHRTDYLPSSFPRLQHQRSQDALSLPPPRSFGLTTGLSSRQYQQPLLPPHPLMHAGSVGNRENVRHQAAYGHDVHDVSPPRAHAHHWEDSHKIPSSITSFRPHSRASDELPPLPYTYNRAPFGGMEEKRESDEMHAFPMLPSRFLRPPSTSTSSALPAVSSIMAATSTTLATHAASTQDHFIGHRHPEPVIAVEPTSIPLLSFLDRNKEAMPSQAVSHHQGASWTPSSTAATGSATGSVGATAATTQQGGSPPLPSIVFPPFGRNNENLR